MERIVCYMATKNYYDKARPSIRSMLMNGDTDKIYVLSEGGFTHEDPKVEEVDVSGQTWISRQSPNYAKRFSWMVMMRAAMHRIFPGVSRILSIDADTIVTGDISELWDLDLDGYYLAGAKEPLKSKGGPYQQEKLYINCGVLMMNLDELRDGKGDQIIEILNKTEFPFVEQDAFNHYCQGKILEIPSAYNANAFTATALEPRIVHMAAVANWYDTFLFQMYRNIDELDKE